MSQLRILRAARDLAKMIAVCCLGCDEDGGSDSHFQRWVSNAEHELFHMFLVSRLVGTQGSSVNVVLGEYMFPRHRG